jgi:hypothetical protein
VSDPVAAMNRFNTETLRATTRRSLRGYQGPCAVTNPSGVVAASTPAGEHRRPAGRGGLVSRSAGRGSTRMLAACVISGLLVLCSPRSSMSGPQPHPQE